MGLFKKKPDPISDRSRLLSDEIAALEAQIKKLNAKVEETRGQPRLRSTARPHQNTAAAAPAAVTAHSAGGRDPVFEPIDHRKVSSPAEVEATPEHFNDLGVRKYDLAGAWRRVQELFRGPPAHNPKLVSYLAAGTIKGLRPLRYEKRVARNRFIGLFVVLVLLLLGIVSVVVRHN